MHSLSPAPLFGEAFLEWFRARTEASWNTYTSRTFEEYVQQRVGGRDWQRGTRWLHGLTEAEIAAAEARWRMHFPPDYRLFLQMLHTVDRPCTGARFSRETMLPDKVVETLKPTSSPSFYNWQTDDAEIQEYYDRIIDGLFFDVTYNRLWPASWGEKPATEEAQKARVQELVTAAPKLIPVHMHRYLLAEPCQAGNPVISISQSDMIVYGANLRDYLLIELYNLIDERYSYPDPEFYEQYQITAPGGKDYADIPFWGEFLS